MFGVGGTIALTFYRRGKNESNSNRILVILNVGIAHCTADLVHTRKAAELMISKRVGDALNDRLRCLFISKDAK